MTTIKKLKLKPVFLTVSWRFSKGKPGLRAVALAPPPRCLVADVRASPPPLTQPPALSDAGSTGPTSGVLVGSMVHGRKGISYALSQDFSPRGPGVPLALLVL